MPINAQHLYFVAFTLGATFVWSPWFLLLIPAAILIEMFAAARG